MATPEPYASPTLTPLPFMAFSKHQSPNVLVHDNMVDEFQSRELMREFGSPLYVVSESRLRRDFRDFHDAFSEPRIATRIAYSLKTNYLPAVCAILRDEGAWIEVVSGMEYQLARALGTPADEIIMNGPHKTRADLQRALGEGALVNIDNFDELSLVEDLVSDFDEPARIGIRINFRYGTSGWTKFGFNDDNGDSRRALKRIAKNSRLSLDLLHHHGGTFILFNEIYAQAANRLLELVKHARDLGLAPGMLDFGGGFPSRNRLKPEFDMPGGSVRNGDFWRPYAEVICSRMDKARDLFDKHPVLILEPGRAVVDGCTQLLCSVVGKKSIPDEGDAVIVDAGINLVPTACYYDHRLSASGNSAETSRTELETVDIYGPLCMQTDKLRHKALLPALNVGDVVVIADVGAYCHTQSMQFINERPATVLIGQGGPELIRRRETWRDVFSLDVLPGRLQPAGADFGIAK